jgi:hypothetical protein
MAEGIVQMPVLHHTQPGVFMTNATTATTVATPAVKAPSKKSLALAIFQAKLTERSQGLFESNKAFRAAVLSQIETELEVTRASASTMFNSAKKEAEAADANVGLGRDPKKVKAPSTGKRGRPAGSKNKAKEATVTTDVEVASATEAAAADAVA